MRDAADLAALIIKLRIRSNFLWRIRVPTTLSSFVRHLARNLLFSWSGRDVIYQKSDRPTQRNLSCLQARTKYLWQAIRVSDAKINSKV
jgi:hypothetical protein